MGRLLWLIWVRRRHQSLDHRLDSLACGVIASLTGFLISAAFVSCEGVELPYYIGIIGAGILKLVSFPDTGLEFGTVVPRPITPRGPGRCGRPSKSTAIEIVGRNSRDL